MGDFEEAGNTPAKRCWKDRTAMPASTESVPGTTGELVLAEYRSVQGQGERLSEGESLWNIKGWKILCVFI